MPTEPERSRQAGRVKTWESSQKCLLMIPFSFRGEYSCGRPTKKCINDFCDPHFSHSPVVAFLDFSLSFHHVFLAAMRAHNVTNGTFLRSRKKRDGAQKRCRVMRSALRTRNKTLYVFASSSSNFTFVSRCIFFHLCAS